MNLQMVAGRYAVVHLPAQAPIPEWATGPGFFAMVRASDELTLVCQEDRVPEDATAESGWACFRSVGPFAFDQPGVVAALTAPLAQAGIGVFVLCTFDGEHLMCKATDMARAKAALIAEGHVFAD
jgi:hypothetical protein